MAEGSASRFDAVMSEASAAVDMSPLSSPSLLLVLREAQAQHGLRHGDYVRYRCVGVALVTSPRGAVSAQASLRACRKYCARKLQRLHRALGFSHAPSKGRFQARVLTPLDVTDARYAHACTVAAT